MNREKLEFLLLQTTIEANIVPITSKCEAKCIFCSHKNNPKDINTFYIGHRTLEQIEFTLNFIDGNKQITIGESATTIIEGEPFSHPNFVEIIRKIRDRFPETLISITTNGHSLDESMVSFLSDVMPVEIQLSLNSSTIKGRNILMGDSKELAERALNGVKLLNEYNISFHGSIVAMPHIVGWDDIDETIKYLSENGAEAIRIFMQGCAQKASLELQFDTKKMHKELKDFVENMIPQISCPLLMEPSLITDLTPIVNGVIKNSKSYKAGIKRGDEIKNVNGVVPRSRVEAWNLLQQPGQIHTDINRNGCETHIEWDNVQGDCGIIMEYDFDMRRMNDLQEIINKCTGKALLLCSEFAFNMLSAVLNLMDISKGKAELHAVKNRIFGGSIKAAGLLTVSDFVKEFKEYCSCNDSPDLIIIPQEPFDYQGYDLMGQHYMDLTEETGIEVKLE